MAPKRLLSPRTRMNGGVAGRSGHPTPSMVGTVSVTSAYPVRNRPMGLVRLDARVQTGCSARKLSMFVASTST